LLSYRPQKLISLVSLFGNKFFFIEEGWGFSACSRGKHKYCVLRGFIDSCGDGANRSSRALAGSIFVSRPHGEVESFMKGNYILYLHFSLKRLINYCRCLQVLGLNRHIQQMIGI